MQLKIDGFVAEKIIPADDSVRLLDEKMEKLDYSGLMRAYSRSGRNPATNPITMFKLLVYGVMDGNIAAVSFRALVKETSITYGCWAMKKHLTTVK